MLTIGNEIIIGDGNIAVEFDSMGLYFIELSKKYPIGTNFQEVDDWLDYQTGSSILIKFTHEAEVHYLYNQLNTVNNKKRTIEYGNTKITFKGRDYKKTVEVFKSTIKMWINKKQQLLQELLDNGLEDVDYYKEYLP